jgi:hypothetical protein
MSFTQSDAYAIAKKLTAEIKSGRRHDLVIVRYQGTYIAQYGITRGSKEKGHDYISRQLHMNLKQCREFRACTFSVENYVELLRSKNLIKN